MTKSNTYQSAFTLVELLVVIAIIALLIAIIVPVVGNAKASAYRATCTSNLRQIGIATQEYVADNDGKMVNLRDESSKQGWELQYRQIILLGPYLKDQVDVFKCPTTQRQKDTKNNWYSYATVPQSEPYAGAVTDYKYNDNGWGFVGGVMGRDVTELESSSWLVVAMDTDWTEGPRHKGENLLAFMDGHVDGFDPAELTGEDPYGNVGWDKWGTLDYTSPRE